ncbi:hypothetical protein M8C21_008625 [Ambrosia artemisiifolia]|uniref:Amidohydrolase-related domain-containing protein n=1 Tax=Ambrosia artemisiifolia TaxID=4212 RepID=A0AAD5BPJ6_AMBAR|nr:hypothetical protein M8C21_008625 [Ambrosia artemisiifolia]
MLAMKDPKQSLQEIEEKDAQFHIQIQSDRKNNDRHCIITKACFLESQDDQGVSTTPQSSTPTPKARNAPSAKRPLMMTPDEIAAIDKGKQHKSYTSGTQYNKGLESGHVDKHVWWGWSWRFDCVLNGAIEIGKHADIVVWEPEKKFDLDKNHTVHFKHPV